MKKQLIPNDVMTDRQLIVRVFNKLRKQGFVAVTKAACCQGCSWAMLDKKYKGKIPDNVVFFTDQDNEAFDRYGKLVRTLYITHRGDANTALSVLREHGFQAEWNGSPMTRIAVTGRVHLPEKKEPKKPTFSFWVFPDSGDAMICTDGEHGGTVLDLKLHSAFDEKIEDGSVHWCVRAKGGDLVALVNDGVGMSLLEGLVVDGHKLSDSEADGMQHEVREYLCRLFALAPKMQQFIRDNVVNNSKVSNAVQKKALGLLSKLKR